MQRIGLHRMFESDTTRACRPGCIIHLSTKGKIPFLVIFLSLIVSKHADVTLRRGEVSSLFLNTYINC